jgi:parallel beta-helix repeat protein
MRLPRLNSKKIYIILIIFSLVLISAFLFAKPKQIIKTVYADGDLATMISSAGTSPITLKLTPGVYNISSDLTIPYNVTLNFQNGAVISIAGGATLSIKGPIDDCAYKIFDDQNTDYGKGVKFVHASITQVRPEWWGANADNNPASSSANVPAMERAMWSPAPTGNVMETGIPVEFRTGTYYIDRAIKLPLNTYLDGDGDSHDPANAATIRLKDNSNTNMIEWENGVNNNAGKVEIYNLRFVAGSQTSKVDGIHMSAGHVRRCAFTGFNDYALHMYSSGESWIEDNVIENSYNGIYFENLWDGWARNNTISVYGEYGANLFSYAHTFTGNDISGNNKTTNCLYLKYSEGALLNNNHLHNCMYGLRMGNGGIITGNIIENNLSHGIFVGKESDSDNAAYYGFAGSPIMRGNIIRNNGGYGIKFYKTLVGGGIVEENNISGNALGPFYFSDVVVGTDPWSDRRYTLIKNNTGVDDSQANYPALAQNSPIPSVGKSEGWKTSNTSATSIIDFTDAPWGKEINIRFGDSNTTLKFFNNKGPELVANGDFSSSSGWNLAPWTYYGVGDCCTYDAQNGVMHFTGNGQLLEQTIDAHQGGYYELTFTIKNYVSGKVQPYLNAYGGAMFSNDPVFNSNGTYTLVIGALADYHNVGFRATPGSSGFIADIDNVSVKEVGSALKGNGGVEKKYNSGDSVLCTKDYINYWHCE